VQTGRLAARIPSLGIRYNKKALSLTNSPLVGALLYPQIGLIFRKNAKKRQHMFAKFAFLNFFSPEMRLRDKQSKEKFIHENCQNLDSLD
jgi:hypothetical protein